MESIKLRENDFVLQPLVPHSVKLFTEFKNRKIGFVQLKKGLFKSTQTSVNYYAENIFSSGRWIG